MTKNILLIDDEQSVRELVKIYLQKAGYKVLEAEDGTESFDILDSISKDIGIVICDINMPKVSGIQVLEYITQKHKTIPVVMLTAITDTDMVVKAMQKGAFDFIPKPFDRGKLIFSIEKAFERKKLLEENLRLEIENEEYKKKLEEKVTEKTKELYQKNLELEHLHSELKIAYRSSIKVLAESIEAKDAYTRGHCTRVRDYSIKIAQKLNFDKEQLEILEYGALLHDVGKIGINENILNKPGSLTPEEFEQVKQHTIIGVNILKEVDFFKPILPIIRSHHEFHNGEGYPDKIKGEEIPLMARIVHIADAFDAMSTDRPYHKGMDIKEAINELKKFKGSQFDPKLVDIFIDCLDKDE